MEIGAADLLEQIDRGTAPLILDVRSRVEFGRGHVPGARHVPFWMPWRLRRLSASRGDPVVVYCGHGPRAWLAGRVLQRDGFRGVTYLAGHFSRWHRDGLREAR
jgi:rhodanese-related sulfurtransferase